MLDKFVAELRLNVRERFPCLRVIAAVPLDSDDGQRWMTLIPFYPRHFGIENCRYSNI